MEPMPEWEQAPELKALAAKVIARRDEVCHIDADEILFAREMVTKPNAIARTYRLVGHPIGVFTSKRFAIVFYQQNCDYMSDRQLSLLMLHELMHIPELGNRLVDHNIQDFRTVLGIDLDWAQPNREVPDILG